MEMTMIPHYFKRLMVLALLKAFSFQALVNVNSIKEHFLRGFFIPLLYLLDSPCTIFKWIEIFVAGFSVQHSWIKVVIRV